MGWTEDQLANHLRQKGQPAARIGSGEAICAPTKKRAKYGNKPVLVDLGPSGEIVGGKLRLVHTFDSQREADYYEELCLRRAAREIGNLRLQESYALIVQDANGGARIVGYYEADFEFYDLGAKTKRIIDVKGMKTQVYALKKKMVEACHGVRIEEV
jgi:hypothetical protein